MAKVLETGKSLNITDPVKTKLQKKIKEIVKDKFGANTIEKFLIRDWVEIQKFIVVIRDIFFGKSGLLAKIVDCLGKNSKTLKSEVKEYFTNLTKKLKNYRGIVLLGRPITAFYGSDMVFGALCERHVVKALRQHAFLAIASKSSLQKDDEERKENGMVLGVILKYIADHEQIFSFHDILHPDKKYKKVAI